MKIYTITAISDYEFEVKFRYDPDAVTALKTLPSHARQWDPDKKVWTVSAGFESKVEELFAALGYQHMETRGNADAKAKSSSSPPPRSPLPKTPVSSSHWETLWLRPGAPPEVIDAAHKALIRKHHPDVGGDAATATAINSAYTALRNK